MANKMLAFIVLSMAAFAVGNPVTEVVTEVVETYGNPVDVVNEVVETYGNPVDVVNEVVEINGYADGNGQKSVFQQQLDIPLDQLSNTLVSPHITVEANNEVSTAAEAAAYDNVEVVANHEPVGVITEGGQKSGQVLVAWQLPQFATETQIVEEDNNLADIGSVMLNKTLAKLTSTASMVKTGAEDIKPCIVALKAGAVGLKAGALALAAKPFILAKKVAVVAGRIIMKPIAIVTGAQLKALGSGLKFAGKVIKGTGTGIAKVGSAVKFTGLGAIGAGASSMAWGLDKKVLAVPLVASNLRVTADVQEN